MKKKNITLYVWMLLAALIVSCDPKEDDEFGLTPAPTSEDVKFSMTPTQENDNIIEFTNESSGFKAVWSFGNGGSAEGDVVKATYAVAGTYTVKLTIYTAGGSATDSTTVEIAETDPSLLDVPIYNKLTGGSAQVEGKTWVVASSRAGHFGVGPADGLEPSYYAAAANEKAGSGLYDDEFTFSLTGFSFMQQTNGDVFINTAQASGFPGSFENAGDFTAPYDGKTGLTWSISEDGDGNQFLSISDNGFIGYYTGVSTYQILTLEEELMVIKYFDSTTPDLSWFETLIPLEVANATPPTAAFSYSISGQEITFTNNTSDADSYLWDFGDGSTSTEESPVHIYSGDGLYTVSLSATNENGSTTTEQMIILASSNQMTFSQLTGDSDKSWKLLPAPGAFGVGPSKGSVEWFGSADLSADRPCLFNDEFIFRADNRYTYNANGDVFAEAYMGLPDGCQNEGDLLGTDGEDWRSGTHDLSFDPGTGSDPSTITVTGTGAFIALPKAYNGGEYAAGPPNEDQAVTYEVLFYLNDGENEVMGISVDVGGAFWNFILKAE